MMKRPCCVETILSVTLLILLNEVSVSQEVIDLSLVRRYSIQVPLSVEGGGGFGVGPGDAVLMERLERPTFLARSSLTFESTGIQYEGKGVSIASLVVDGARKDRMAREFALQAEASFGPWGRAALDLRDQHFQELISRTIYLSMSVTTGVDRLAARPEFTGRIPEQTLEQTDQLRLFIHENGTHYVERVMYGYQLLLRARVSESESRKTQDIKGELRASFMMFSTDVSARNRIVELERSGKVSIEVRLVGGRLDKEGQVLMTGIDQVVEFIDQLRAGGLSIAPGPIAAELRSYSNVIGDQPEIWRLLYGSNNDVQIIASEEIERAELRVVERIGRTLGQRVSILHQSGDPGGLRQGVAETDGFVFIRAAGPAAKSLRVRVNGQLWVASTQPWGAIICPIPAGATFRAEGWTGGSPTDSMNIPATSIVVSWLPIGIASEEMETVEEDEL